MRKIIDKVLITRTPEKVFNALLTPSMICKWWSAEAAIVLPEVNGIYAVRWGENEDDPDYITTSIITEIKEPDVIAWKHGSYYSKSGALPFDSEMHVRFTINANKAGSLLQVEQTGIPDDPSADEFYNGCVKGWQDTLASIKTTLESDN